MEIKDQQNPKLLCSRKTGKKVNFLTGNRKQAVFFLKTITLEKKWEIFFKKNLFAFFLR